MPQQGVPVWLITGCSTGFGRELAKLVLERGWCAVVTARDPKKIQDLVAGTDGRGLALKHCGYTPQGKFRWQRQAGRGSCSRREGNDPGGAIEQPPVAAGAGAHGPG